MKGSVVILLVLLVAILFLFRRQVRGRSLDELIEQSSRDHRRVHKVLAKHPHGGTWQEFRRWLAEEEEK